MTIRGIKRYLYYYRKRRTGSSSCGMMMHSHTVLTPILFIIVILSFSSSVLAPGSIMPFISTIPVSKSGNAVTNQSPSLLSMGIPFLQLLLMIVLFILNARLSPFRYYVLTGGSPKELINNFTFLTGRMPLPPKWVLGNLLITSINYYKQLIIILILLLLERISTM